MGKQRTERYMLCVNHDDIGGRGLAIRVADYPTRDEAEAAKAAVEKGTVAKHVSLKVYGPHDPIP